MAKELDVDKVFEAIAKIISAREEGVQVTVKSIRKIDKPNQEVKEVNITAV